MSKRSAKKQATAKPPQPEAATPSAAQLARHVLANTLDNSEWGLGKYGQPAFKKALIDDVRVEVAEVEAAPDPRIANRHKLANYVVLMAKYQVLILPGVDEDEPEVTGLRGRPGISGALKAHIFTIAAADKYINETAAELKERNPQALYEAVLFRYWVASLRAQVFDGLRLRYQDVPVDKGADWYPGFIEAMCAYQEYDYRKLINLPQILGPSEQAAAVAAYGCAQYLRAVLSGDAKPGPDWTDPDAAG